MAMRRGRIAAAVIVLLVGVSLIAYPYVSDFLNKRHQMEVIQQQSDAVGSMDAALLAEEMAACVDYNQRLLASRTVVTDPFDPSNQPVSTEEYEERLNLNGDGVMGTISLPSIDTVTPVYHGTGEEALANGGGHMDATSLPVGGESTHAVIAGHNGLPSVRIFDDLHNIAVGDYFVITVLGEDHAYRVTSTETVLPDETESLAVEEGKDLVTLVTCTPYGVNTHRLLVHAERCEVPAEWYERDKAEASEPTPQVERVILPFTLAGLAVGAGALGAWALRRRAARREEVEALERGFGARLGASAPAVRRSPYSARLLNVEEPVSPAPAPAPAPKVGRGRPAGKHFKEPGDRRG